MVLLFVLEVCYFKIADRFNIIDKPNLRSSQTRIVLRGGGIIFTIALWIWSIWSGFPYPWLLAGVTLAAGISFIDDIHSLPDSVRLVVQFASMFLVLCPAEGTYGIQVPAGVWHTVEALEPSVILEVKDGASFIIYRLAH